MKTNESRKILVIDDDADSRVLLQRALRLEDYPSITAADGSKALELLTSDRTISLILMDLSMPGPSGADFLNELRSRLGTETPPVILVSGWDRLPEKAKALGVAGCVRKPVELDALYEAIEPHFPKK